MKKFFDKFIWWFYSAIGFLFFILLSWIVYWAYVSISNVTSWQPLTATTFNEVLENQRVIKTIVDWLSSTVSWLSNVPAWFVWAFNLSSCPASWIPANGTNGTPDLRWEFIRWLDNGRWADTGRILWTSQQATDILSNYSAAGGYGSFANKFHNVDGTYSTEVQVAAVTITSWPTATVFYNTVRPRNVALLYCVKQ